MVGFSEITLGNAHLDSMIEFSRLQRLINKMRPSKQKDALLKQLAVCGESHDTLSLAVKGTQFDLHRFRPTVDTDPADSEDDGDASCLASV